MTSFLPNDCNVTDLFSTLSLQELLSITNKLEEEVQQLEGSSQALIYDNYSEFLIAADTVQTLDLNKQQHDNDMKSTSNVINISDTIQSKLNQVLQSTRYMYEPFEQNSKKIQRLSRLSQLINYLSLVLKLPDKMKEDLTNGQFNSVVSSYLQFFNFLSEFRMQSPFDKIYNESLKLFLEGRQALLDSLASSTTIDINTSIALLLQSESVQSVVSESPLNNSTDALTLLNIWKNRLREDFLKLLITNLYSETQNLPIDQEEKELLVPSSTLKRATFIINHQLIPKLLTSVNSVPALFQQQSRTSNLGQQFVPDDEITRTVNAFITDVLNDIFNVILTEASSGNCTTEDLILTSIDLRHGLLPLNEIRKDHQIGLKFTEFLRKLASKGIENKFKKLLGIIIKEHVEPILLKSKQISVEFQLCEIDPLSSDVHIDAGNILNEKLDELISECAGKGQDITVAIATTLTECEPIVGELFGRPNGDELSIHHMELYELIQTGIMSIFSMIGYRCCCLLPLVHNKSDASLSLTIKATTGNEEMKTSLNSRMLALWNSYFEKNDMKYSHISCLSIVLIIKWVETKAINKLRSLLRDLFPCFSTSTSKKQQEDWQRLPQFVSINDIAEIALAEVSKRWGRQLHYQYIELFKTIDWKSEIHSNSSVETYCRTYASKIILAETVLQKMLGASSSSAHLTRSSLHSLRPERHLQWVIVNKPEMRSSLISHIVKTSSFVTTIASSSSSSSSSLVNVDRLLNRRAPIALDRLQQFGWPSAFLQILRVLFKGILETIRETTFSESGAKQLQIDISWLRDVLNEQLGISRNTALSDSGLRTHPNGYSVLPRQIQSEEAQFKLISILTDEIILASISSIPPSNVDNYEAAEDEVEILLRRLVTSDELDRIILNERPL